MSHKIVAIMIIVVTVVNFIFNFIILTWKVFPRENYDLYVERDEFEVNLFSNLTLPVSLIYGSEDSNSLRSVRIIYDLYISDGKFEKREDIARKDIEQYILIKSNVQNMPPLGSHRKEIKNELTLFPIRVNNYILTLHAVTKDRIRTSVDVKISTRGADLSQLAKSQPAFPIFASTNTILDISPDSFLKHKQFKIIYYPELERTNLAKVTLLFNEDYLGARGGFIWTVHNVGSPFNKWPHYYGQYDEHKVALDWGNSYFSESLGFFNPKQQIHVPIGTSIYRLEMINDHTIKFHKQEGSKKKLDTLKCKLNEYEVYTKTYEDLGRRTFKAMISTGASGRMGAYSLCIEEDEYIMDWTFEMEQSTNRKNFEGDFPLFINASEKKEGKYFLEIDLDTDSDSFLIYKVGPFRGDY